MQVMLPREQAGPRAAGKLRKMYGTGLQSSIPRDKEAGVFIHQLPLGHWLRAASRHINSPVLPTCPELAPRVFPPPGKTLRQRAGVGSKEASPSRGKCRETRAGRQHLPHSALLFPFLTFPFCVLLWVHVISHCSLLNAWCSQGFCLEPWPPQTTCPLGQSHLLSLF